MLANYFFIDGSALTSQIRQLRRADPSFKDRKLCPKRLMDYLMHNLQELHDGQYKRITFYFPVGDEATIEEYLVVPDHRQPGEVRDLHFKFCGQKLKRSAEFNEFVETKVPAKFQDRFSKSEKGIDIEICCDGLKLASASRLERLFLLTNDDDFVPFCRAIKEFGANISIIHLSDTVARNVSLLREADSYDVVPRANLQQMFLPVPAVPPAAPTPSVAHEAGVSALKPDTAPSDMAVGTPTVSEVPTAGDTPKSSEMPKNGGTGQAPKADDVS
jgi:uncharacterized LabA/DUF88 family protein